MGKFARILVPVDGSDGSGRALDTAVAISEACGAALDILYVSYFNSDTDGDMDTWLPDFVAAPAGDEIHTVLEQARRRVPEGIEVKFHQRTGKPAKQIVEFSKENGDETIVICGRGLDVVRGFLLGSVSQEVMEAASGAVIVVK